MSENWINTENKNQICAIGQHSRCNSTGCEWKKAFGYSCSDTKKVQKEVESNKKKREVEKPKTEKQIKKQRNKDKDLVSQIKLTKQDDFVKVGLAKQDDWLKKMKFLWRQKIKQSRTSHLRFKCSVHLAVRITGFRPVHIGSSPIRSTIIVLWKYWLLEFQPVSEVIDKPYRNVVGIIPKYASTGRLNMNTKSHSSNPTESNNLNKRV